MVKSRKFYIIFTAIICPRSAFPIIASEPQFYIFFQRPPLLGRGAMINEGK